VKTIKSFLNNDFFRISVFSTTKQMYPEMINRVGEEERKQVKKLERELANAK